MNDCADCEYMKRDKEHRMRCYSPQLVKFGFPGILVNFECDVVIEGCRSHEAGTGKCGPQRINYIKREGV